MRQKKEFLVGGLDKMRRLAGIKPEITENTESPAKAEDLKESDESDAIYTTKFEKRNKNLFENVDRMKKLSGLSKDEE